MCDSGLLRPGLTLPGFLERSKTIASLPNFGLLTLAALTPRKHEVQYLEIPELAAQAGLPDGFDLAGMSSYSARLQDEKVSNSRRRGFVCGHPRRRKC